MKLLKHFKERILDDVPYVICWRAYTTASAVMMWAFIMAANMYFGWELSLQMLIIVDWAILFLPMLITAACIVYYIVLLVLALCKKAKFPNPDAEGMTTIVPYRWFAFVFFTIFISLAARVVQLGIEEISISHKVFPFGIICYASVLVLMAIDFVARLFRREIQTGNSDEAD